jgi:hypothetical protein
MPFPYHDGFITLKSFFLLGHYGVLFPRHYVVLSYEVLCNLFPEHYAVLFFASRTGITESFALFHCDRLFLFGLFYF